VGVPTIKTGPMTVEEYFAFTDTRPDNEKWELIDGEPILNTSPIERQRAQSWEAIPGIGFHCRFPRFIGTPD
jgi:hypothetical protein